MKIFVEADLSGIKLPDGFGRWLSEKESCDGCGTKWFAKIVPDSIYLLDISKVCCIHDYRFSIGGTIEDFEFANEEFRDNLKSVINKVDRWWYPTELALKRADTYYKAVSTGYALEIFLENNKDKE